MIKITRTVNISEAPVSAAYGRVIRKGQEKHYPPKRIPLVFSSRMLQAKKSLGQNFLVDKDALVRIAKAAKISDGDLVVEIGPGTGLLTKELLKFPLAKLVAYEVDDRAIELLRREITDSRFEVRREDVLHADLGANSQPLRVVGNIPYYITSPIIFKLIDTRTSIRDALLLVQLEVAERLTARPRTKEYGIPTVLANFFGEVELLFKIKAGSFRPIPKVDSALVRIDFAHEYFSRTGKSPEEDFDHEAFRRFVRTAFAMRRKMLRNTLKAFIGENVTTEPRTAEFLMRRAEELSIEEFLELYSLLRPR